MLGKLTGIFAGELIKAHAAGCSFVAEHATVKVEAPYDVVITTNSGYPLDQIFFGSSKALAPPRLWIIPNGPQVIPTLSSSNLNC